MGKDHKVLMLVENVPAPADTRVWPEAITLRDSGFQVCIISPKQVFEQALDYTESYCCIDGIHIYRYNVPTIRHPYINYILEYSISLLMMFLLSLKVWHRHGFDVIHAANPPDLLFLIGLFYRPFGKKFIFDQHDPAPELFLAKFKQTIKPLYHLLFFLEKCSYRTAHAVITSNLSQRRFAVERGHCDPEKVFVVRNGPDLKQVRLVTAEPDLKRGFTYLLAYVGAIGVQDGVEYCLYALHDLVHKRGRRDVSLVLMGGGEGLLTLQNLTQQLLLCEYVHFTGWTTREDVMRYLTVADVGLVPDPQNGMNEYCTMVKTMEYMALGKPVVAFDLVETRYTLKDGGLLATPNVVEDFVGKIATLLDDERLRHTMGEAGRKRVEETLRWDETRKNLLRAYESLFPSPKKGLPPALSHSQSPIGELTSNIKLK